MNKKIKIILIAIICIIGVLVLGTIFKFSRENSNINKKVNTYETAKVKKGELKINVSASGIVIPENKMNPDYDKLEFQLTVDELDIVHLKKDQSVNIEINAFPDKTFKGKITYIADNGNVVNGVTSYDVIVKFDKDYSGLKSGMTGTGNITVDKKSNILYIPIEAINQNDKEENYVIIPSTGEEKIVSTGIHNDDSIEIKKGLKDGDEVQLPTLVKENDSPFPQMPMMNKSK